MMCRAAGSKAAPAVATEPAAARRRRRRLAGDALAHRFGCIRCWRVLQPHVAPPR